MDKDEIDRIEQAVKMAVIDTPAIQIKLKGVGAFPNFKNPRVFWAGIEEPTWELNNVQARIEDELDKIGFPKEKRDFSPHLTIARIKNTREAKPVSEKMQRSNIREVAFKADQVIIMQSVLKPSGAVYTPLRICKLTG